jgi:hypothetical protein
MYLVEGRLKLGEQERFRAKQNIISKLSLLLVSISVIFFWNHSCTDRLCSTHVYVIHMFEGKQHIPCSIVGMEHHTNLTKQIVKGAITYCK